MTVVSDCPDFDLAYTTACGENTSLRTPSGERKRNRIMKHFLLLGVLVVLAATLVSAQGSGTIQINNGSVIEAPAGQQPQVVVQFGNQGNAPLTGVRVVCRISEAGQGSLSFVENQIYPHAMQTYALTENTVSFPEDEAGVELIAGQNQNVGFNVLVEDTEGIGVMREVICEIYGDGERLDSATVVIQTPGVMTPELTPEATETPEMTPELTPEATETPELGTGDVQVTLSWDNDYDLDLYVTEPGGEVIFYDNPLSDTGGELDVDANFPCGENLFSVENVFWEEDEAPTGEYLVSVVIGEPTCDVLEEADWTLTVRVQDDLLYETSGTGVPGGSDFQDGVDVVAFRVEEDGSAVIIGLPLGADAQSVAPEVAAEDRK